MILRILDRYIIRSFLYSFMICCLALVSTYMIIDSFTNLDELVGAWRAAGGGALNLPLMALRMNVTLLPYIMYLLMPVLVLSAGMFTVVRMRRANELTPLLAAGVSIYRVVWPVFLMAVILTAAQVVDREVLIPKYSDEIFGWELIRNSGGDKIRRQAMLDDSFGNVIFAGKYDIAAKKQHNPMFSRYWEGGFRRTPMIIINAQMADWRGGARPGWSYSNGTAIEYDRDGNLTGQTRFGDGGYFVPLVRADGRLGEFEVATDATPQKIEAKEVDIFFRPSLYLLEYVHVHGYRADIALDLNKRMAAPIANFILLLVGLPFVLKRDVKSPFLGLVVAVAITGCYFALGLVCDNFALEGRVLSPLTGAWAPIIIFGPIGVILFDTVDS